MVKTLGLLSCTKSKQGSACKAREMYSASSLFRKAYTYTVKNYDFIAILSAKYSLLLSDDVIAPYNLTLNNMTSFERRSWATNVFAQLNKRLDLGSFDKVFFHAGKKYREHLIPLIENVGIQCIVPLRHLTIGPQLAWYAKHDC